MRADEHSEHDDAALVSQATGGNEAAFAILYRRHAPAVRHVVADQLPDRDRHHDLVQEAFVRAFTRLTTIREPSRFRSWLLTVAKRLAVEERTRLRRRPVVSLDDPAVDADVRAEGPTPGDIIEAADLARRALAHVATLPTREALAINLAATGAGPSELGHRLGVSPGTARLVLHRARHRLRAAVA
jgi:RNA polymerase sigma factor (sigma-70 family)